MTEGGSRASRRAAEEARELADVAATFTKASHPHLWDDLPPQESSVVRLDDPTADLDRRGAEWGYMFTNYDLADVARFAAGLAQAESEAWADDEPHVATRAYEARRFLLADRLMHWAVPWLDAVGRCYPSLREEAHSSRDVLLALGDRHRPAPVLSGPEGLHAPGEDGFGPVTVDESLTERCLSLWSGAVVMRSTIRSLLADAEAERSLGAALEADTRRDLAFLYEVTGVRWRGLAREHPGTERLWLDLAARAARTAAEWTSG